MRSCFLLGVILSLFGLSGCDQDISLDKFAPPQDVVIAQGYIDLLRDHRFELIEKDVDPSLRSPDLHETLVRMASYIPTQPLTSSKIVGVQINDTTKDGKTTTMTNISFEYQYPGKWMVANLARQKKDGVTTIVGISVYQLKDSLENANKFTLTGKSWLQYLALGLAVIIPLFILYALILCVRTRIEKRKWLWIVFYPVGSGAVRHQLDDWPMGAEDNPRTTSG